ncbi:hypothetical protein CBR_g51378 [Chara braunii]|uniref:Uncharacterized protein n=1 Tax=Chara braunii TaxID=69332 RepID=A0A388M8T0_CHABU|nr:hypothetical protein CBR_g51378 [Chara braunii]|eukprot:GBG90872.1 hypothetical protein CBR_g51378 [Chara braunii]
MAMTHPPSSRWRAVSAADEIQVLSTARKMRSADASATCLACTKGSPIHLTYPSSSLSLPLLPSLSHSHLLLSALLPSKITTRAVTSGVRLAHRQCWKWASSATSSLFANGGGCSCCWFDSRLPHPVGLSFLARLNFHPRASTRGNCAGSRKLGGEFGQLVEGGVSTVARATGRVDGDGGNDAMAIQSAGMPELTIGSAVVLTETPEYVKTAEPMPMLKVNRGILKAGDAGRVIDRRPKDVWAIRFSVGAFLIDRKYFKTFE